MYNSNWNRTTSPSSKKNGFAHVSKIIGYHLGRQRDASCRPSLHLVFNLASLASLCRRLPAELRAPVKTGWPEHRYWLLAVRFPRTFVMTRDKKDKGGGAGTFDRWAGRPFRRCLGGYRSPLHWVNPPLSSVSASVEAGSTSKGISPFVE